MARRQSARRPKTPIARTPGLAPLRTRTTRATGRPRRALYSAAFYADLGPAPTVPDVVQARLYWMRIVDLIDKEGAAWTRNERTSLRRLEKVWRARMLADDGRWLLVGTRPGRLTRALEEAVRPTPAVGWGAQFGILPVSKT